MSIEGQEGRYAGVLTVVGITTGRVENCEQRSVSDLTWNV
jgi:hypothetical protein